MCIRDRQQQQQLFDDELEFDGGAKNLREEVSENRQVRDEDNLSGCPFARVVFVLIRHGVPLAKPTSLTFEHSGFVETGRDVYDERETVDV